jgi:hypothetical protein
MKLNLGQEDPRKPTMYNITFVFDWLWNLLKKKSEEKSDNEFQEELYNDIESKTNK